MNEPKKVYLSPKEAAAKLMEFTSNEGAMGDFPAEFEKGYLFTDGDTQYFVKQEAK